MESDILRQHSLALSHSTFIKTFKPHKGELKSSYNDVISVVGNDLLQIRSKHCKIDGRRTARETLMKNKPHQVILYESILVSL